MAKKSQSLVYVLPAKGTFKISEGTKIVKEYAFINSTPSKVYIPASVTKLEAGAFHVGGSLGNERCERCDKH